MLELRFIETEFLAKTRFLVPYKIASFQHVEVEAAGGAFAKESTSIPANRFLLMNILVAWLKS